MNQKVSDHEPRILLHPSSLLLHPFLSGGATLFSGRCLFSPDWPPLWYQLSPVRLMTIASPP